MPSYRLDTFVELEQKLSGLRVHYQLCQELSAKDVLDWAKFFLRWSQFASEISGPWAMAGLLKAEKLVSDLSKPKPAPMSYETLDLFMAEAQMNIQEEIFRFTAPKPEARRVS